MTKKNLRNKVFISAVIAALALAIRLPGFGLVMTVDEENWMVRGAEFYDELFKGNIGGTFLTTHPGSIPMWLIGGGETLQEKRLGFQAAETNLIHFRRAAIFPLMLLTAALTGLIAYLLGRLFSFRVALAGGLLLALEPYVVGMTTIAHLDGLQGLLMLASLLAFFLALRLSAGQAGMPPFDVRWTLGAGILCGLAFGFKLILALWLVPVFAAILFIRSRHDFRSLWQPSVRMFGFVVGVAVLVLWLGWPALWVKEDVARSLEHDYVATITDEHVALEAGDNPIAPQTFYIRTVLGRVTPHVQLLVVGSALWLTLMGIQAYRRRPKQKTESRILNSEFEILTWLLLYSLGFLILITLAAKKADRYALPALVVWPIIAGWAAARGYQVASSKYKVYRAARYLIPSTLYILLAAIIVLPLLWLPHALAYNNPFFPNIRPLSQQGWGEGLEEAAAWLNQRPGASEMYIASWYPSVMQTYFMGKTLGFSSRDDYRVQYLVTYRNMGGRAGDTQASDVLDELKGRQPAYIVSIHGVPYAWIYETFSVGNFTKHVGELTGSKTVGQTVQPEKDNWRTIDLGFATFSSRHNSEDVIVHVRTSSTDTDDLRTARVNATKIVDNEWQAFTWEPIAGSAGREFYVLIESPASVPGNAVTVRYTDDDVRPGQFYLNGKPKTGDIAYRLPE